MPPPADSSSLDTEETSGTPPSLRFREYAFRRVHPDYQAHLRDIISTAFGAAAPQLLAYDHCCTSARFARNRFTNEVRVLTRTCKSRWCPICGPSRSRRLKTAAHLWLAGLTIPKFLTLTLAHSHDPLSVQVRRILDCFKLARRDPFWKRNVRGGFWSLQITYNSKTQTYHVHLHALLDAEFLPHRALKRLWHRITGDSFIVDVRAIHDRDQAAHYVARYATRAAEPGALPLHIAAYIAQEIHGTRTYNTFGSAHKSQLFKKPRLDKTLWENLGEFSEIAAHVHTDSTAYAIWYCFTQRIPLFLTSTDLADRQTIAFLEENDPWFQYSPLNNSL